MKKLWLGVIGLAAATTANAAVVTLTLSLNDDGFGNGGGTSTPGSFAVYADVSQGDNFGLFAFGVDLTDGPIDFIANMSPQGQFRKTGSPTKFVGFSAGVTEDAAGGKISGLPDLAKGVNLIPAYGLGQTGGDLNTLKPTGYGNYVDSNPNAPGSAYNAHLLLGIGQFHGPTSAFKWDTSVDNKASVYTSAGGSTASAVAQLVLNVVGGGGNPDVFKVSGTAENQNLATGNQITVTGSNHLYVSEVDQLTSNANQGSAPVVSIGDESGNLYTMAKITGDAAAVSAVLAESFNNGAGDAEAAHLHSLYDAQFGPGGFNFLNVTPNFAGAKVVNWNFATNTGAVVDQLAVVPEPASMTLLGLGALGLLARRRRHA